MGARRASTKRARRGALLALKHGSFVTASGRQSLLKAVRDRGLPNAFSRRTQLRARQDENPLAPGPDHRKVQTIYWSLRELGDGATYTEAAWFTLAVLRSELVQKLQGGMAHVFHHMLPFSSARRGEVCAHRV